MLEKFFFCSPTRPDSTGAATDSSEMMITSSEVRDSDMSNNTVSTVSLDTLNHSNRDMMAEVASFQLPVVRVASDSPGRRPGTTAGPPMDS